jgi:endogenous inhibitor of DNA gyrase (YacG/DUF329 family)
MSPPADACPVCGKAAVAGFSPFCCRRCADIDLGRWLKGGYVIPGGPGSDQNAPATPSGSDPDEE